MDNSYNLKTQEGFTLIESILVLFIIGLIFSFPIFSIRGVEEDIELDLFFEELSSSITMMQNHAILNNQPTYVEADPELKKFLFRVRGERQHELNHELIVPDSVTLIGTVRQYEFQSQSGNQGNLNRLRMDTNQGRYELVFQMGSGRFEIRKVD